MGELRALGQPGYPRPLIAFPWRDNKRTQSRHRVWQEHTRVSRSYEAVEQPSEDVLGCFVRRRDSQIMGLELLAISFSLGTFADLIRGRRVVLHSDNTGSEVMI